MTSIWQALAEPFAPWEVKWRVQGKPFGKQRRYVRLVSYIDARAVSDRLDEVVGPDRWRNTFREGAQGGLVCRLEIWVDRDEGGAWVWKEDGAENTQIEGVKGGMSDAFKRSAVQWGIGRYLYRLPAYRQEVVQGWANGDGIDIREKGQGHIGHAKLPKLPPWALPSEGRKETPSEQETRRARHDNDWENGGRERFMADLSEIYPDEPQRYEALKRYLLSKGGKKPSEMGPAKRDELLEKLRKDPDRRQDILVEWYERTE